jgi:hypothetical protein
MRPPLSKGVDVTHAKARIAIDAESRSLYALGSDVTETPECSAGCIGLERLAMRGRPSKGAASIKTNLKAFQTILGSAR